MAHPSKTENSESTTAYLGFESKLWLAADSFADSSSEWSHQI